MSAVQEDCDGPCRHTIANVPSFDSKPEFSLNMRNCLLEAKEKLKANKNKKNRKYTADQLRIIGYLEAHNVIASETSHFIDGETEEARKNRRNVQSGYFVSKVSIVFNVMLLVAKIVACFSTGSISIISSALDSAVDILSSLITFLANYNIRRLNVYKHPQGKTRLIPLSIIIISCIMAMASFQVVSESMRRILTGNDLMQEFSYTALGIVVATILIKMGLFLLCCIVPTPSAQVLAQDHRNDVLSNIAVLLGLLFTTYSWVYADPVCALLISIYVLSNWICTGKVNLNLIVGRAASPHDIQKFTWVCFMHDPPNILFISTVRAYSFGNNYLLEVDIVLDGHMLLSKAHDIGESLQNKLEDLPEVERAFVHCDFEKHHNPAYEHKLGSLC